MPAPSEFVEYLTGLLQPLGEVRARAMFGGWGFFLEGRMFALVALDAFYIKADEASRAEFTTLGLEPFRYETKERVMEMAYFQPPAAALDDGEMLCDWARKGVAAAGRAAAGQRLKGRGKKARAQGEASPAHDSKLGKRPKRR